MLAPIVSGLLILLIGTYLITSANAGIRLISTILSGGVADSSTVYLLNF